jgi:hypothetical protein
MGLKQLPPIQESADRCTLGALDKFADTRANFSQVSYRKTDSVMQLIFFCIKVNLMWPAYPVEQEASGGGMTEAFVDVRGCTTFSGKDLRTKVGTVVLSA